MSLTLRGVSIVDPEAPDADVPRLCDVVVGDDGHIARIVPAGTAGAGPSLDGRGLHAVPGLIDSHVHLCFDPNRHPEQWLADTPPADLFDIVAEHAAATLRAGVTTVRDLGSRDDSVRDFARAQRAGHAVGPSVLAAGPVITTVAGHCHYVGTEITHPDRLDAAVEDHLAAGDQWIKVMVTGGALTTTSSPEVLQFAADDLRRIVHRAGAADVPVAAHVLTAEGGALAVAAGVRTIEHGIGLSTEDLNRMRAAGQALVPVLSPSHQVLSAAPPDGGGEHARRLRRLVGTLRDTTARAVEAGVAVLAGTDAGCPGVAHGSVVGELVLLRQVGLSAKAALAAATSRAARVLRLDDVGRIAIGARADIVLVDTDPLTDLEALAKPVAVLQSGRLTSVITDLRT